MPTPTDHSALVTTAPPARLSGFPVLYQFSLRTLLIVMTLASIACWWYLQPDVVEKELAGKHLKLRQQVHGTTLVESGLVPSGGVAESSLIANGYWRLVNQGGDLLVEGNYRNDQPQGNWTLRHANGRKAAEGYVLRGARSGVWQMWDEEGVLRSEVNYRSLPHDYHDLLNADGSLSDPVWGMIGNFSADALRRQQRIEALHRSALPWPDDSQRHGPCRSWHANGQLQCQGAYRNDHRNGRWTWYDEQGNVVEQGTYRDDVREGEWLEQSQSTNYIAGQKQAVHEQLMIELKADLLSPNIRRQVAAATRLEELGPACVPLLVGLLAQESDVARLLALRALVRHNAVPAELLPQIEPLIEHPDSRLALRAMLAVYQLRPERREALIEPVVAAARKAHTVETLVEAATIIYQADPERRQLAVNTLVDQFAGKREPLDAFGVGAVGFDEALVEAVCRLGDGVLPYLASSFDSPRAEVRQFVLAACDMIVRRGPGKHVTLPNNHYEVRWPIPPSLEQMLIRAKTDPDPAVRARAEQLGRQPGYGSMMSGGIGCYFGPPS